MKKSILKSSLLSAAGTALFSAASIASTCSEHEAARGLWASNMATIGRQWGEYLNPAGRATAEQKLESVYYDGEWIFNQIASHLGQSSPWDQYATWARMAYFDNHLIPSSYRTSGYRRFTHGPLSTFKKGTGQITLAQMISLRDSPAFSTVAEFRGEYAGNMQSMSRELAYAIQANINAEKAGATRVIENGKPRVESMVAMMEDHFSQWESGQYMSADTAPRFAPFMAALSAHALIEFMEWEQANGRDPNRVWSGKYAPTIEASLKRFFLWARDKSTVRSGRNAGQRMWGQENNLYAFRYQDVGATADDVMLAYDLNGLLAYPYAWLAKRYSNGTAAERAEAQSMMETADELFIGNVRKAYIGGLGKIFNQSYRLSFLYLGVKDSLSGFGLCGSNSVKPRPPANMTIN